MLHGFDNVVVNHLLVRDADDAQKIRALGVALSDTAGDFEARAGAHQAAVFFVLDEALAVEALAPGGDAGVRDFQRGRAAVALPSTCA